MAYVSSAIFRSILAAGSAMYAASDEFHQRFVPSRQASVWDVLLDTAGGLLALILLRVLGRWRRRC